MNPRWSPVNATMVASIVWAGGLAIALSFDPGVTREVVANLTAAGLWALLAIGSFRRARLAPTHHISWSLMGLAGIAGTLIGAIYSLLRVFDLGPTGSDFARAVSQLLTIVYPVLILLALVIASVRIPVRMGTRIGGALEGTIMASSCFLLLWLLGLREVAASWVPGLEAVESLVPFVGSAATLGVAIYLRSSIPFSGPLGLVAAWATLGLVSEGAYAYLTADGSWYAAHPLELFGTVRLVPLAVAPWLLQVGRDPAGYPSTVTQDVAVLLPPGVALVLSTSMGAAGTLVYDPVVVLLFLVAGSGVLVRQLIALQEARSLSRTLEVRVEERTAQLAHAHRALEQTQRLEAIGRLAGGVAHDFNNLLTAIGGNSELIKEGLARDDPLRDDLEAVELAVDRGTRLTRKLLTFARRNITEEAWLDLNPIVEETAAFLDRVLPDAVRLQRHLGASIPRVCADPGELDQLVTNLIVNARDAVGRAGTVTVTTDAVDVDAPDAALHGVTPGRFARLSVADDGTGIPDGALDRIFEPFFTTKPPGEGTGLGLATCFGIASGIGGFMTVDSTEGEGCTFRCWFPTEPTDIVRGATSESSADTTPSAAQGR